jgi:hypothetical protein
MEKMNIEKIEFYFNGKKYNYSLNYFQNYIPLRFANGQKTPYEKEIWDLKKGNSALIFKYFCLIAQEILRNDLKPVFICPPSSEIGIGILTEKLNYYFLQTNQCPFFEKLPQYPTKRIRDLVSKYNNLNLRAIGHYKTVILIDDVFTTGSTMNSCYLHIIEKIKPENLNVFSLARTIN